MADLPSEILPWCSETGGVISEIEQRTVSKRAKVCAPGGKPAVEADPCVEQYWLQLSKVDSELFDKVC